MASGGATVTVVDAEAAIWVPGRPTVTVSGKVPDAEATPRRSPCAFTAAPGAPLAEVTPPGTLLRTSPS